MLDGGSALTALPLSSRAANECDGWMGGKRSSRFQRREGLGHLRLSASDEQTGLRPPGLRGPGDGEGMEGRGDG
jgi:hypothetical protein